MELNLHLSFNHDLTPSDYDLFVSLPNSWSILNYCWSWMMIGFNFLWKGSVLVWPQKLQENPLLHKIKNSLITRINFLYIKIFSPIPQNHVIFLVNSLIQILILKYYFYHSVFSVVTKSSQKFTFSLHFLEEFSSVSYALCSGVSKFHNVSWEIARVVIRWFKAQFKCWCQGCVVDISIEALTIDLIFFNYIVHRFFIQF